MTKIRELTGLLQFEWDRPVSTRMPRPPQLHQQRSAGQTHASQSFICSSTPTAQSHHEARSGVSSAAPAGGVLSPHLGLRVTCGGSAEPGAPLPLVSGAELQAPGRRGGPSAPATRPLGAVEDVPQLRAPEGPGQRPLHRGGVRSPREHHPLRPRPR